MRQAGGRPARPVDEQPLLSWNTSRSRSRAVLLERRAELCALAHLIQSEILTTA